MTIGITGLYPSTCMSQYLDNSSVFSSNAPVAGPIFGDATGLGMGAYGMGGYGMGAFGYGFGLNDNMMNMMIHNSDNMTNLQFVNRSNGHTLESYGEIMQKNMPELSQALREGNYGRAAEIFDETYAAVAKNYGREITNRQDRLNMDQSIRSTITRAYQQINGSTIGMDAAQSDEGYFYNGFMRALTFNNHHKATSEEIEAYMTGTKVEGHGAKNFQRNVGKVLGHAAGIGAFAATGAAIGAVCGGGVFSWATAGVGAAIGAGVGLLAKLGAAVFGGDNEPSAITDA